jgi:hypothetical protein
MAAVHSLHLHARTMDAHTDHHQGLRVPLTPTSPVEVVGLLLAISLLRASSVHRHAGLPPGAERRRIPETSPRPNLFFLRCAHASAPSPCVRSAFSIFAPDALASLRTPPPPPSRLRLSLRAPPIQYAQPSAVVAAPPHPGKERRRRCSSLSRRSLSRRLHHLAVAVQNREGRGCHRASAVFLVLVPGFPSPSAGGHTTAACRQQVSFVSCDASVVSCDASVGS